MPIIQYASDLHLEFPENADYLAQHPLQVAGEVLVVAGDSHYLGSKECTKHPFWDWASDHYEQVAVIPGNHEFYGGFDLDGMHEGWRLRIRSNVAYHYNDTLTFGDTELILSPMWSTINIEMALHTQAAVNDFRRIRCSDRLLDWVRFNEEHFRCFHFLHNAIRRSAVAHIVVVTHHLPSFELLAPEFLGSPLNGAFVTDLHGFIKASPVEYWIYGHSHRNIDRMIGRTQCLSNQLGYVSHGEHLSFDPAKAIIL